ncbi:rhodanese-like domain-containing protein [Burkholderia multivorans]|uniref:rhodanese-like domain-containing protein n=1 Tax=Burkholderia multivorans TaxID=87883 RepID=UPI0021BECBD8|nr:rhodanese-like domain-containing protein [Burkholderia multivorans]MDR8763883.1 Thiosulfate sulfurtransferase GlpE [Burkholderia multivorans]MDR8766246.1 Thiosulfate sulfurtransferase GlpE [Burkholderia multivorans]MDR8769965.1 Thiosulfate sulfurtransferase GlpE [Burkholderia multivorans]MDR8792078.1 Thiosulfate sulfurtransferase GlpE [Burkholderia multivorans]MDR8794521.1 Thiosulfate sulfurtransferase GlpE [Burkholderia multivorans]
MTTYASIDHTTLRSRLAQAARVEGDELAVVDVRETLAFSRSHLIFSTNLAHERLEVEAIRALPRATVPIVLIADNDEAAAQSAARLQALGYTDISVMQGGLAAWQRAGLPLYAGFNVRSKAFAERVGHVKQTPSLDFETLTSHADQRPVLLDSRTVEEYRKNTVPGAIHVPGADLVRKVRDLVTDDTTPVVVACGGRTRSIIGAQSLIDAGLPNPVYALRNGTGGLRLQGVALESGANREAEAASRAALAWAGAATEARVGAAIRKIAYEQYARWQQDVTRTLYTLDLRPAALFEQGHVPGSKAIAGGQLIQEIDLHAPVVGARIALVDDDDLVRARMTAHWLQELGGFEVAVVPYTELAEVARHGDLRAGAPVLPTDASISAADLHTLLSQQTAEVVILDLSRSPAYLAAHLPRARWVWRAHLAAQLDTVPVPSTVILTSEDGALATWAWHDLHAIRAGHAPRADVRVLAGGNRSWIAAGYATDHDTGPPAQPYPDVWVGPQARGGDVLKHVRAYLDWEIDLVRQVGNDADFNALTRLQH